MICGHKKSEFMPHIIIPGTQQCMKCMSFYLNFTDGCMVVPVGHYTSNQSAFEWRISFNHSERLLSTSLNCVQRHCYCLTKLLLKTGEKFYCCSLHFSATTFKCWLSLFADKLTSPNSYSCCFEYLSLSWVYFNF